MKLKIACAVIFVIVIIGMELLIEAKNSGYHPVAVASIEKSTEVSKSIGKTKYLFMIGSTLKIKSNDASCVNLTYFVCGDRTCSIVMVYAKRPAANMQWEVYELHEGLFSRAQASCK